MEADDKLVYSFSETIKLFLGVGGWHFVNVPAPYVEQVKKQFPKTRYGFIPIIARIGEFSWETSLMPSQGTYIIALKAEVRKDLGVQVGDRVSISFLVK